VIPQGSHRSGHAQLRHPARHVTYTLRDGEANPLRARMVADPAEYRWSSSAAHGLGHPDPSLCPLTEREGLGPTPASRQARWRRQVRSEQPATEVAVVRESSRTGLPLLGGLVAGDRASVGPAGGAAPAEVSGRAEGGDDPGSLTSDTRLPTYEVRT
jgi:hypothetical protein